MTLCEWIVCEHSDRWAAALHVALARRRECNVVPPPRQVRSLGELAARLADRPLAMACIEVRIASLADVLAWLAETAAAYPQAWFIALLDDRLASRGSLDADAHDEVVSALGEAGAAEVVVSPRHLHRVLSMGRQQMAQARAVAEQSRRNLPLVEWARASLPWQDT